jgi:hypothetical protein
MGSFNKSGLTGFNPECELPKYGYPLPAHGTIVHALGSPPVCPASAAETLESILKCWAGVVAKGPPIACLGSPRIYRGTLNGILVAAPKFPIG